ncbi:hypothetical protein AAVH_15995 [Aphelenchoides avenae]|nr:hypothetical protein AAVH_15995 [Aphelenchus avenae]
MGLVLCGIAAFAIAVTTVGVVQAVKELVVAMKQAINRITNEVQQAIRDAFDRSANYVSSKVTRIIKGVKHVIEMRRQEGRRDRFVVTNCETGYQHDYDADEEESNRMA